MKYSYAVWYHKAIKLNQRHIKAQHIRLNINILPNDILCKLQEYKKAIYGL